MHEASPYATGGGGVIFEHQAVAICLAKCLMGSRLWWRGTITLLRAQQHHTGALFDDVVIVSEENGHDYVVEVQIRSHPRLVATDKKFRELIAAAIASIEAHTDDYQALRRQLTLLVDRDAMNTLHLARLTDLARRIRDYEAFSRDIMTPRRHSKHVRERWKQLVASVQALGWKGVDEASEKAWQVASNLTVVRWGVEGSSAETRIETINELARLWSPADHSRAEAVLYRLQDIANSLIPSGGQTDRPQLMSLLGDLLRGADLTAQLDRASAIAAHRSRPRARIVARLRELGVDGEHADRIAASLIRSGVPTGSCSPVPGGVIGYTEEVGSGKSTLGDLLLVQSIEAFSKGDRAEMPVLVDAKSVDTTLESAVLDAATGLGDPSQFGCGLILDGIDEVGVKRARALVSEAYALANHWPNTWVVLLSRPLTGVTESANWRRVTLLSDEQAAALVTAVLGEERPGLLHGYPDQVREAVRRPLFAILLGLWLAKQSGWQPSSLADLVAYLVSHTLDRLEGMASDTQELLRQLAVLSLKAGAGRVSLADIPGGMDAQRLLLRTGLVRVDFRGWASFSLALLADWFAAQHLLLTPGAIRELVSDVDSLMRWRYAIANAVSRASYDRASQLLGPIAVAAPALCGWIVEYAIVQHDTPPEATANALELGRRIVEARRAWAEALGRLAGAVVPTGRDGRSLATLGIRANGGWISIAWYRGPDELPPVVELPTDVSPLVESSAATWTGFAGFVEGRQDAWPWRWSWQRVADRFADLLRSGVLVEGAEALREENEWALAQIIVGRRPQADLVAPIYVHELEQAIQTVRTHGAAGAQHFGGRWSVTAAERLVSRLRALGKDTIASPWYGPTQSGTHVLEWRSADAAMRRARAIIRAALSAYDHAISTWLPTFKTQLRTVRLAPFRVVGSVAQLPMGSIERYGFRWYLEPIGWSESTEDEWRAMSQEEANRDDERIMTTYAERMMRRPDAPSIVIHHGMPALASGRPAALLAVEMLWGDLQEWKWTHGAGPFDLDVLLTATQ